jgi:hypothetical protein
MSWTVKQILKWCFVNPKGVSRCWITAMAIFSVLAGRIDLMDRTFWSLYISSSPFYKRHLFDGMHTVMSVNDPDDFNRAVLGTSVQNSWSRLFWKIRGYIHGVSIRQLDCSLCTLWLQGWELLSVLKMAVCEGQECCVLASMKRIFLWQCKGSLIASAVEIHEVKHRFWLWMIVRVVAIRAKLSASNPCVTNVLDNLGVLVSNVKSKPLCSSQSFRPIQPHSPSHKAS